MPNWTVANHYLLAVVVVVSLLAKQLSWAQEEIASVEDFKMGLDNGDYDLVLDVRTDAERATGHIPGSIHVPLSEFASDEFLHSLTGTSCQKECATIVATCAVGGRAASAIRRLRDFGFRGTLINGLGTSQWTSAGYELTTTEEAKQLPPVCASTDICPDATVGESDSQTMESGFVGSKFGSTAGAGWVVGASAFALLLVVLL